ncbi:MAG: hypothetical protein HY914_19435 [Desulfomonile tiedjei]|nr:hypothetical protein [Desulfomonile tiedjei]
MRGERGSALAVVLLILGVLGLLGAGLMVQTRYDTKVVSAQGAYDKMLNLADGAAKYSLFAVRWLGEPMFAGRPALVGDSGKPAGKVDSQTVTNMGDWTSLAWYLGPETNPWVSPGWESPTYYMTGWVAKGSATKLKLDAAYEIDQAALFATSEYANTQRQQVHAQSSALISATKNIPKE